MARTLAIGLACACLLTGTLALHGCGACSDVGCGPSVVARVDLLAPTVAGDRVTACRLGDCRTASLPTPGATETAVRVAFAATGGDRVDGLLWNRAGGRLQLEVQWQRDYSSAARSAVNVLASV